MQTPPVIHAPARTTSLATTSLVCGICGFLVGPLAGIPAIITGHLALRQAERLEGPVPWKTQATAGLILGYGSCVLSFLIFVLAAAGFTAANAAIQRARNITCLSSATALESALTSFHTEYGKWPIPGDTDIIMDTTSPEGIRMLRELLGIDQREPNIRSIRFLVIKEGKNRKNGLVYDSSGSGLLGLFDPWGGAYTVVINADGDSSLDFTMGNPVKLSKQVKLMGRNVAVYSSGPDGSAGTEDDVKTW